MCVCVCVCVCVLSYVQLFVTPWTVAHQEIFLTQGLNPSLLHFLYWQVDSLLLSHLGSPCKHTCQRMYSTPQTSQFAKQFDL